MVFWWVCLNTVRAGPPGKLVSRCDVFYIPGPFSRLPFWVPVGRASRVMWTYFQSVNSTFNFLKNIYRLINSSQMAMHSNCRWGGETKSWSQLFGCTELPSLWPLGAVWSFQCILFKERSDWICPGQLPWWIVVKTLGCPRRCLLATRYSVRFLSHKCAQQAGVRSVTFFRGVKLHELVLLFWSHD